MNTYNPDGTKKQADQSKIRLGQRIEAMEARTGEPSPQRILAEKAMLAFDAARTWDEARALIDKADLTLVITDRMDEMTGKITWGGYIKDDEGRRVKLSALPKGYRYKDLERKYEGKTEAPAKVKPLTANRAKSLARKEINAAGSMEDVNTRLAAKGMRIETYGKSGAYLRFAEGDEGKIKLSALGGKYSLSALNKRFNANSSPHALNLHESQLNVNASSKKDASGHASAVQSDRVSSAQERAEAAEDKAAAASANAVQAGADGMEGFFELDFFEQIDVMRRVGNAEAAARAATAMGQDAE